MKPAAIALVLVPLLLAAAVPSAAAAEIRVISGGAAKSFVQPLADSFKSETGNAVLIDWQPMGTLVKSLAAGQPADMLIVTSEVLEQLERDGKLPKGAGRPLARVGVGVAVNERAADPDISTADAFRRTLLAARSVVYIDPAIGTSGKHVAQVLERLGIAEQMKAKTTLLKGGYVVEPVGRGEIELGIHQISEMLPVKGVRVVGPLPAELQKYTTYVAVPIEVSGAESGRAATVEAFIRHLTGQEARSRLAAAGYSAPQ
jgi:molybdate transport system substrate-binding protein